MVVDTSAVVAVLMGEPEEGVFAELLVSETTRLISAVAFYEAGLVMAARKRTPRAALLVDDLIRDLETVVVTATSDEAVATRNAYFRYGRPFHPAGLNFADCFSYVLGKPRNKPLLFKDDVFSKTDIVPAWRP